VTDFTGERLVPGQVNQDLWAEHISRYTLAARYAQGVRVLDIGCGTGYGTAFLAQHASQATGIDIAPDAIEHARKEYPQPNLEYLTASATEIPLPDATFDLITAFEVIEHLESWPLLISEARRLLKPDGMFLVSTPNKLYYTESRGAAGPNPYHVHEFEYEEFRSALKEHFPNTIVLLQNRSDAFVFYPDRTFFPADVVLEGSAGTPADAYFFLGACSVAKPMDLHSFVFVPQASNLLRIRERHIAGLEEQLADLQAQFNQLLNNHHALEAHLEDQNRWGLQLDQEVQVARERLTQLQKEFEERTAWALQLNGRVERFENSRWVKLGRKLGRGQEFE
jgi:SAM-dependent methyltransferase